MASSYLGVDYGERRIGLALSTDGERATAWRTLRVDSPDHALDALTKTATRIEGLAAIVIGLPRNLDGDDTAQTRVVRLFSERLAAVSACPVELVDEAGTSSYAEEILKRRGKFSREDIDAEAAAMILQDYLDQL